MSSFTANHDRSRRPEGWRGRFCFVFPLLLCWLAPAFGLDPADRSAIWTQIWDRLDAQFIGFDKVAQLNWRKEYADGLAALKSSGSDVEFWRELRRRVARLENGRTQVKFPVGLPREYDTVPMRLELIDERVIVKKLSTQEQLAQAGIRVGDELSTVDGIPAITYLDSVAVPQTSGSNLRARRALAVQRMLTGLANKPVHLGLLRPTGERVDVLVQRDSGVNGQYLNDLDEYPPEPVRELATNIIYVDCFSHLVPNTEQVILAQIDNHPHAQALILDFRESRTGVLFDDVLARLIDAPVRVESGSMIRAELAASTELGAQDVISQEATCAGRTLQPQAPQFSGKLVVLTSALTAGPAEEFLHALGNRVMIIGDTTAGAAHQVAVLDLQDGAALTYAVVRPAWGGALGDGIGIAPSVRGRPTPAGMAAGKDEVLEQVLQLLK